MSVQKKPRKDKKSNRDQVHRTLAWQWIRVHRPDVEQLIRLEGEKRYPPRKLILPKALQTDAGGAR